MIDLTIDKKGLDILASMKGKTLKSLEGEYFHKFHRFSEIVRFKRTVKQTQLPGRLAVGSTFEG